MPTRKNRLHHVLLAGEAHRKKASATAVISPRGFESLTLNDNVDMPDAYDSCDSDDLYGFNPNHRPPTPPPPPRRGGQWVPGANGLYRHANFLRYDLRPHIYYKTKDIVGLATRLHPPDPPEVSPPPLPDRCDLYIHQNGLSVPNPQDNSVYTQFEYVMAGFFHPGPTGATAAAHAMGRFWQTYLQPFGIVEQFSQHDDIVNADDPMTVIHDLIVHVWLPAINRWVSNAWPILYDRYPPTDPPPELPNDYDGWSREQQADYMRFHPEHHRIVAPDDDDLYS